MKSIEQYETEVRDSLAGLLQIRQEFHRMRSENGQLKKELAEALDEKGAVQVSLEKTEETLAVINHSKFSLGEENIRLKAKSLRDDEQIRNLTKVIEETRLDLEFYQENFRDQTGAAQKAEAEADRFRRRYSDEKKECALFDAAMKAIKTMAGARINFLKESKAVEFDSRAAYDEIANLMVIINEISNRYNIGNNGLVGRYSLADFHEDQIP